MLKKYAKQFGLKAAASSGAEITPEMLVKINAFALKPLTLDEVFARKVLMCHSAIDRDNERFPEDLLDLFAATFPGKSFLFAHDRGEYMPLGLFFDAITETMSAEQFKTLTGEEPRLPEGMTTVKVVWAWFYTLKATREDIVLGIDAGIYRHFSIGFRAADIRPVKKDVNGPTLYWEYVGPGETTEGSLVWLGAQPGATVHKSAGKDPAHHQEGEKTMKQLLLLLGGLLGKSFADNTTEDVVFAAVKDALGAKDAEIIALKQKAADLEPLAADGKGYRDSLVTDYVRMKAALGEADADDTKQAGVKSFAAGMQIDMLKQECKHLQTRMDQKFPNGQLDGSDPNHNRDDGKGANDNPLIVKD